MIKEKVNFKVVSSTELLKRYEELLSANPELRDLLDNISNLIYWINVNNKSDETKLLSKKFYSLLKKLKSYTKK